ncbi:MAG: SDR family NAD(P)-dependent oxidoreductase [Bradyrhizobium sp.]|nr:SDR family NAD(P)-dependent oxidoreductase [Bradyrhizobium sp.]
MKGNTVFITGSTDGVGRYVAIELAAQGANVLIHVRDAARADAVMADIKRGKAAAFYQADLYSRRHDHG